MDATSRHARLERLLDRLVSRQHVAHAIVAVESLDGSLNWIGAAGDADGRGTPMRETTPYHVASVTKLFTAALILRLHEREVLDLESPITEYLPEALTEGLHRRDGVDHTGSITVRHLLQHTSGLANYFEDRPRGGRSLAETVFTEGDRSWAIEDVVASVRDRLRPHFAPGQRIRYSDTNYQMLGSIAEHAAGRGFAELLDNEILGPLELADTHLAGRPKPGSKPPATLFHAGQPMHRPLATHSVGPDGSLISTVRDQLTFLRSLFGGKVFDRRETLELMTTRWRRFGFPLDAAALRAPSWPIEYGLGIMRFRLPRLLNGMRPMPAAVGHTGSSGSWLFHVPNRNLFLSGTVDEVSSGAVPYRFLPSLLQALE